MEKQGVRGKNLDGDGGPFEGVVVKAVGVEKPDEAYEGFEEGEPVGRGLGGGSAVEKEGDGCCEGHHGGEAHEEDVGADAAGADGEDGLEDSRTECGEAGEPCEGLGFYAEGKSDVEANGESEEGFAEEDPSDGEFLLGGEASGNGEEDAVAEDEEAEEHGEEDEHDGVEEEVSEEAADEAEGHSEEDGCATSDGEDPPELAELAEASFWGG